MDNSLKGLLAVLIILMVGIVFVYNYISGLKQKTKLLEEYQLGFSKCTDFCQNQDMIGYMRAIDDFQHKCFCYNWSDNSIREKTGG